MSLAARTKQWSAGNLQILRARNWLKGVFTLVSSEYRTRAQCPGTKFERCLIQWEGEKESGWPESCQAYVHSGQTGFPSANIRLLVIDKLIEEIELV